MADELKARQATYQAQSKIIRAILNQVNAALEADEDDSVPLNPISAKWLDAQMTKVEEKINKNQEEIYLIFPNPDEEEKKLQEAQTVFRHHLEAITKFWIKVSKTGGATTGVGSSGAAQTVIIHQEDRFDLVFDSEPQSWLNFENQWEYYINQPAQAKWSDAKKLNRLLSAMKKDSYAQKMVAQFPPIHRNYNEALKALKLYYNKPKDKAREIMKDVADLPNLTTARPDQMENMINVFSGVRLKLDQVEPDKAKQVDLILQYLAREKIDNGTRIQWDMETKEDDKVQPWATFSHFVLARAKTLKDTKRPEADKGNRGKSSRMANHGQVEPRNAPSCACCKMSSHRTYQCQLFKDLKDPSRTKIINDNSLCKICLATHPAKDCPRKTTCSICQSPKHCTLAHHSDERPNQQGFQPQGNKNLNQQNRRFGPRRPNNAALPQSRQNEGQNRNESGNPQQGSRSNESDPQVFYQVTREEGLNDTWRNNPPTQQNKKSASSANAEAQSYHIRGEVSSQILLATAVAKVSDQQGRTHSIRILLDNGSDSSLITEETVRQLKLPRTYESYKIRGIGGNVIGTAEGRTEIELFSNVYPYRRRIQTLIVKQVTGNLPRNNVAEWKWPFLNGLPLADPQFYKSRPVDMLLGADHYGAIMRSGRRTGLPGSPYAQESVFGWVISGPTSTHVQNRNPRVHLGNLDKKIDNYFYWEDVPNIRHLTPKAREAEEFHDDTTTRGEDGTFTLRLPIDPNTPELGDSTRPAEIQFDQLEKSFKRKPEKKPVYKEVIHGHIAAGHVVLVPKAEIKKEPSKCFLMPHHAVFKDSTSTKCRVVFNASQKTSTGVSLNDKLLVGPKLQDDIFPQLLKFRKYPVALTADVKQMYLQFKMHPDDQDYQRFLWRDEPEEELRVYKFTTLVFGLSSSPYQAVRCLQRLATEEQNDFPSGAKNLKEDTYMDDLTSGDATTAATNKLYDELTEITQRGGLQFTKWLSSDPKVMEHIPESKRRISSFEFKEAGESNKTLGVRWNPIGDTISYTVASAEEEEEKVEHLTKRMLLSYICMLWDPYGYLSPVTVVAKINMKLTHSAKLKWDDTLPAVVRENFRIYRKELKKIEQIKLPRCVTKPDAIYRQLHGFGDASEKAFAACVYIRSVYPDGSVETFLLAAKTKIAQQIALPYLELSAAVLTAKLLDAVKTALKMEIQDMFGWSDSTITLSWLNKDAANWKTYVANRVAIIQAIVPREKWHHIDGKWNPADCASRGITVDQLITHPLWWKGPPGLQVEPISFPVKNIEDPKALEAKKKTAYIHQVNIDEDDFITRYSKLHKLIRVVAWMRRFIHNSQKKVGRNEKFITVSEMQDATIIIIKKVQAERFQDEINCLKGNKPVSRHSSIKTLAPVLDEDGVLKVGGRLALAEIPEGQKFPVLLPGHHHFSKLIIDYYHHRDHHAGNRTLLAAIRQKFWILRAKSVIRNYINKCRKCQIFTKAVTNQQMGILPSSRVNPARAFEKVGLDYAGPFFILTRKGRGNKTLKAWVAAQ